MTSPIKRPHSLPDSFRDAFRGLAAAFIEERNMRIHFTVAALVTGVGLWLGLDTTEWALLALAVGAVIGSEMMNSAVERAVDLAEPHENGLAARAKDLAAGAVLVVSCVAGVIGLLVLGPKLWHVFFG